MGCDGGQIGTPWSWFQRTGVVSGGLKEDRPKLCYPYTMDECEHHVPGPKPSCPSTKEIDPTCPTNNICPGDGGNYKADKHRAVGGEYGISGLKSRL